MICNDCNKELKATVNVVVQKESENNKIRMLYLCTKCHKKLKDEKEPKAA